MAHVKPAKSPQGSARSPAKSLKSLSARSRRDFRPQSPAKSRVSKAFSVRKVLPAKSHPYGGRPGVPPPVGPAYSPWGFGVVRSHLAAAN